MEKPAGVYHADHTAYNQRGNGDDKIDDPSPRIERKFFFRFGVFPGGKQISLQGIFFMGAHGAEVHPEQYAGNHHDDSEQGIIIVRDSPDKNGKSVFSFHKSGYCGSPGRNRGYDADRGGSGIDQVCQFCTRNFIFIRNGAHDAAYGQAVKIVVNENQHAQCHRGKLCAGPGLDFAFGEMAESSGAAGSVHQADHSPQNHKEYKDAHIVSVGEHCDETVIEYMGNGAFKGKTGVEQAAHQNAYEQGTVDFFCDKCQKNGHDRRD